MIHRIVLIKLKDDQATDAGRAAVVTESRRVLPSVPQVRAVHVGVPADDRSRKDWDILIEVHFDSLDDAAAYIVDPIHRAYVDDFMKPRIEVLKAWNFAP